MKEIPTGEENFRDEESVRIESSPRQIATRINIDRNGFPVLWVPLKTGGETEGADIEFHLESLGVPFQVAPVTRDRQARTTSPLPYQLRERIGALQLEHRSGRVLVVCFDDVLSTGFDVALLYNTFNRLRNEGGWVADMIHDIKVSSYLDRIGASDPGYAVIRTLKPAFNGKEELVQLYRECGSVDEYVERVAKMRGLYLPEARRATHRRLLREEEEIELVTDILLKSLDRPSDE